MDLQKPVSELYLIGPTYAKRLAKLEIKTVGDLLYHFPHRYLDYSLTLPIARIRPGEIVSIKGEIVSLKNEYTRSGKKIQKAIIQDKTGLLEIIWFNQPFLVRTLKIDTLVNFSGKIDWFGRKMVLISPEYEIDKGHPIHTTRLVPVYHETYGISSKWLRARIAPLIKDFVSTLVEFLPPEILSRNNLLDFKTALAQIHFPDNEKKADEARNRFAYEELFFLQLAALKRKQKWQKNKAACQIKINQAKTFEFIRSLPFKLTNAQKKAAKEILADLSKNKPMNRLLEGDVGSGKTVVAALAILQTFLNGYQSVLMAPTEILAWQHFKTLKQLLTSFGLTIGLLTGNQKQTGNFDLIIGTHALIYPKAKFNQLGLAIIDEQHRFGVEQRALLINKTGVPAGKVPHILTMTATPIPRTIALTLYGDLDLSVIDEMPPERKKIKTWIVPSAKRTAAYSWIKKQITNNQTQAFIICPLIEESFSETLQSVKAVTTEFEHLQKKVFPDLKLGLLHGRLKSQEKEKVMTDFQKGKLDILVSTPVVEVGIDVPKATIMLIEDGQRFGLAQLHQLRGRVGRSSKPAYCLVFSQDISGRPLKRLKALERIDVGFKLAELDLKMRGPGEVYGIRQHGFIDLKIADFSDRKLISQTRQAAEDMINKIRHFPLLKDKLKNYTIKNIEGN